MNIAVIGAGWWGKNIINSLENIDDVDHTYIFDSNMELYSNFSKNKKVVFLKNIDQIIQDNSIKAVCIVTPPPTHFELTKTFLQYNKHVLVEKPPALTLFQLYELIKIAHSNNLVYMLDALFLFLEPIKYLGTILNSGQLEDIRLIQMYRIGDEFRREGNSLKRIKSVMFDNNIDVIDDLFFHDAGILVHLFEDIQFKKIEKQYSYDPKLCDSSRIYFEWKKVPVELTLSWSYTGRRRGMTIYDKTHIIEYDGFKNENQISIFSLLNTTNKWNSFSCSPPLTELLKYFINCFNQPEINYIGGNFMIELTKLWERIKNEK